MSGGVDSAVTAYLMRESGYDCIGATMLLAPDAASSAGAATEAAAIADALGMPFLTVDFSACFRERVIAPFVEAYEDGRTPNPCIFCNRYLKFGRLLQKAEALSCDVIATGHYARVERDPVSGRMLLKKALDPKKDQSYVLFGLSQEQLSHVAFPLGTRTKTEVRQIARDQSLPCAEAPESQDICFVPDGDYGAFIENDTGRTCPEGDFVDRGGHVLGRHRGIIRYTVGQRKGLGVTFGEPRYVLRVNAEDNTVVLGTDEELFTDTLFAKQINLISRERIDAPMRVTAKVRYRHPEQKATVEQLDADTLRVVFDEPQRAITPGQAVVLYDGDRVVGGGIIRFSASGNEEPA